MSEETIFSKIVTGEIPCTKVYEDGTVLAFLDIQPIQPGHTLVIPKKPSTDVRTTEPQALAHMMRVAQQIAQAQTKTLKCDGVNIYMNCGAAAGQEVFHTHIHVIPRHNQDDVIPEPLRGEYESDEEKVQVSEMIRAGLK